MLMEVVAIGLSVVIEKRVEMKAGMKRMWVAVGIQRSGGSKKKLVLIDGAPGLLWKMRRKKLEWRLVLEVIHAGKTN